ncbi:hypothetical protein GXW74_19840 [Roseomonas eburnea]|uniref:Uncharacterized protein n=1 Tax=Neoroseomonas eburnea TaxID=1346889 RepID=A0A9X9XGB8_9PROT|nr:hypothetical protein [Neoroseomonas eburnea]MBR0682754.1 hypothetical protein [Neoroseomonas eburnea]
MAWPGLHSWMVVFEPTTSAWWGRFLARGFGHCWAMGFDPAARVWVGVEPLFQGTLVRVLSSEAVHGVFLRAKLGEVRLLSVPHVGAEVVRPRFCVTCAGAVASLLGLRRFPLTPWGLFWTLRRMPGVKEIWRGGEEAVSTGAAATECGGDSRPGAGCAGEGAGRGPAAA